MEKIKCGDANPGGNVALCYKGGCMDKIDILDAYRCTGCGGYFHLNCIFEHFQQEEKHDFAHKYLRKIKNYAENNLGGGTRDAIVTLAKKGLDRKKDFKRANYNHNK